MTSFTGVRVFSASMMEQRLKLGETITEWLTEMRRIPGFALVEVVQRQSSDRGFHLVSIVVFYSRTDQRPIDHLIKPPGAVARRLNFKEG